MKVSVAIAVYNAAATIEATLDSVLCQTVPPDEILVVNDGSTDQTPSLLRAYGSRITVIDQQNAGLSGARNVLFKQATGDLIAFLDADDLWHPRYLEVQRSLFSRYPNASALFTGHINFRESKDVRWDDVVPADAVHIGTKVIRPHDFLSQYTKTTGPFASPSYCCVPMKMLRQIGTEPFDASVRVCDDAYMFYSLSLRGPVVYAPARLAAYRITPGSLSSNRLRNLKFGVYVFELLDKSYRESANRELLQAFQKAFASKRREYAKVLMGIGDIPEARKQLRCALNQTGNPESVAKSLALSILSYMPAPLQPTWPSNGPIK